MNNPLLSFLGIAKKAGALIFGMDPVKKELFKGKVQLIIAAGDISKNSLKEIENAAAEFKTEVLQTNHTKEDINFATGKYSAIIGINDNNFSNKIKEISQHSGSGTEACENKREECSL